MCRREADRQGGKNGKKRGVHSPVFIEQLVSGVCVCVHAHTPMIMHTSLVCKFLLEMKFPQHPPRGKSTATRSETPWPS